MINVFAYSVGDRLQHMTSMGWVTMTVKSINADGLMRFSYDHNPDRLSLCEVHVTSSHIRPIPSFRFKAGDKIQRKTFTMGWVDITVVSVDQRGIVSFSYDHTPDEVSNYVLPTTSENLRPRLADGK